MSDSKSQTTADEGKTRMNDAARELLKTPEVQKRSAENETTALFDDLPDKVAPEYRETDEHLLKPCDKCSGSGKWFFWEEGRKQHAPCRRCEGVGRVIVYLGSATHV